MLHSNGDTPAFLSAAALVTQLTETSRLQRLLPTPQLENVLKLLLLLCPADRCTLRPMDHITACSHGRLLG
jgi:hypothetical protein